MYEDVDFYNVALLNFEQIAKKPTNFLEVNESFCNDIKTHLKKSYDFTKNEEIRTLNSNALSELSVQNFDLEQIWQQIELQNDTTIPNCLKTLSKLIAIKNRLLFNNLKKDTIGVNIEEEITENESNISTISEEDFSDDSSTKEPKAAITRKNLKPSVVDDEFFKLDEMEQFLRAEEKKLQELDSGNDSDSDETESNASVNLFEGNDDDDDDDDDDAKRAKYKDFFVTKEEKQQNNISDEEQPSSSYQLRQERLLKKIEQIEEEAVQEKPWQLKGEITAENRPQNSLLEEVVEFDMTTRPAPVITEQTTLQLEDIIKQRIKDKVFDSVERKTKPVENLLEYKKKIVLDQEKSKESLAQIYEKEYLQQQAAIDSENANKEEEPELHKEINQLMKNLFSKLDALSNFHFTPKAAVPDLKIISNLPAINVEEVVPSSVSDAALLAPEEVQAKTKGDVVGKSERTATDKKRERRKKKLKQKIHASLKQKQNKKPLHGKNVEKMDESSRTIKSSKAFFTHLQEQVQTQIKRKSADTKVKKTENNAKKLKL